MSFVKIKKENEIEIKGVKASIRGGKVASTGCESLDFVIGGGLELSSVFLLGEDKYTRHSAVLTRLFLADGVHNQHQIYFVNLDEDPKQLLKEVPPGTETTKESSDTSSDNDLRIAFRYQALPKIDSVQRGSQFGTSYDLSKKIDPETLANFKNASCLSFKDYLERKKLHSQSIFEMILDDVRKIASESKDNLLRICINSLGSPTWYSETFKEDVLRFLVQLKSLVRYNDNVVCLITSPLHLISFIDDQLVFRMRKIVDSNVNLESFDNLDKKTNEVFKQYHGLLHVKKLQTITAHQSHKPESFDLAFKLRSHRLVIEKLHLPPELGDGESSGAPSMSCATTGGGGGNKSLDF